MGLFHNTRSWEACHLVFVVPCVCVCCVCANIAFCVAWSEIKCSDLNMAIGQMWIFFVIENKTNIVQKLYYILETEAKWEKWWRLGEEGEKKTTKHTEKLFSGTQRLQNSKYYFLFSNRTMGRSILHSNWFRCDLLAKGYRIDVS